MRVRWLRCLRVVSETNSSAPVAIEILDDAAGVLIRIAQAGQYALDELALGTIEIQFLLVIDQCVYGLFQIHRRLFRSLYDGHQLGGRQ